MKKNRLTYLILVFVFGLTRLNAQTKLASVFGDHMVLQRHTNIQVWGTDTPNTAIEVLGSWGAEAQTKTDSKGKWKTSLKTVEAGGPYTLAINGSEKVLLKDILLGEVWLCGGQSNMAMPLKGGPGQHIEGSNTMILNSTNSNLRFFTVKSAVSSIPLNSCKGTWEVSEPKTAANFSAVGYAFGLRLQKHLNVPVGLISSNVGGTPAQAWTPKETITSKFPEFDKELKNKKYTTQTATGLYNAMIQPLVPFSIKGVIWYQGESNAKSKKPGQYAKLFPAMIASWRNKWNKKELPFYFVQIAPFGGKRDGWVRIQQAQLKTMLTVPNTGMAVINDIGYKNRIHPPQKKKVGERLALWALAKDYGVEGIIHSGPTFKSMTIEKNKVILLFNNAPFGITSMGKPLTDFEITGADGVYYPATAKIPGKGIHLQVWSDKVEKPVHVRYAWRNYVEGCLFNTGGLPASCFTTEDWSEFLNK